VESVFICDIDDDKLEPIYNTHDNSNITSQ